MRRCRKGSARGRLSREYISMKNLYRYSGYGREMGAMVSLAIGNSRMKDFAFDGPTLAAAIGATFSRRGTMLPPAPPIALTDAFAHDDAKQRQW